VLLLALAGWVNRRQQHVIEYRWRDLVSPAPAREVAVRTCGPECYRTARPREAVQPAVKKDNNRRELKPSPRSPAPGSSEEFKTNTSRASVPAEGRPRSPPHAAFPNWGLYVSTKPTPSVQHCLGCEPSSSLPRPSLPLCVSPSSSHTASRAVVSSARRSSPPWSVGPPALRTNGHTPRPTRCKEELGRQSTNQSGTAHADG
jgi:hypothetical protein